MPAESQNPISEVVIVTTKNVLRALIDEAVDRATERVARRVVVEVKAGSGAAWIPVREAARILGRHRSTLLRWRKAGLIESRKIAGSVYVERNSLNWAAQTGVRPDSN